MLKPVMLATSSLLSVSIAVRVGSHDVPSQRASVSAVGDHSSDSQAVSYRYLSSTGAANAMPEGDNLMVRSPTAADAGELGEIAISNAV